MIKRFTFIVVFILIFVIITCQTALAYDSTWGLTHGLGCQKALIIGRVTSVSSDTINCNVIRVVNGIYLSSKATIQLSATTQNTFKKGDGVLASLDKDNNIAFGIFKVQVLKDTKIIMNPSDYDVGFIEWYVNTGENDNLYEDGNNVYRNQDNQLLFDGKTWYANSLDAKYIAPYSKNITPNITEIILCISALTLAIFIIFWILHLKRKLRTK